MHVMLGPACKLRLTAQLLLSSLLQLQMLTTPSEVAATSRSGLRGPAEAAQRVIIIIHRVLRMSNQTQRKSRSQTTFRCRLQTLVGHGSEKDGNSVFCCSTTCMFVRSCAVRCSLCSGKPPHLKVEQWYIIFQRTALQEIDRVLLAPGVQGCCCWQTFAGSIHVGRPC
jgi:hypothetical protein